jgi:LPS O-antigen subunit length determinant protein (WzzB/FepE family)
LRGAAAEITIRGLLETLWRGWWLLLVAIVLALLVTTVALKLESPLYTATMIVAPAPTDLAAASQLASELEEFASLATLAQSPVKLERVSNLERYVLLFGSTALAARLQAEHGLLQTVFESDWDAENQVWRQPQGLKATIERAVLGFFGFPSWTAPDIPALAEWLDGRVGVNRLGGGAMLRLRMEHARPEFAAAVVAMVHETADAMLREDALARVDAEIALAERELAAATAPTRRQALEDMLRAQYQVQAVLQVDQPYAAQVMVPVTASATPTSPNPLLILALAAMVGAILGIFAIFLRDAWR